MKPSNFKRYMHMAFSYERIDGTKRVKLIVFGWPVLIIVVAVAWFVITRL